MRLYRRIDEGGEPTFGSVPDGKPLPKGAVEVDRWPGPFEDFVDGKWVYNGQEHADFIAGPAHIAEAHAQKRIEALLIKSGVVLDGGLLAAEAALRGVTPEALADLVITKSAAFKKTELARQKPGVEPKT